MKTVKRKTAGEINVDDIDQTVPLSQRPTATNAQARSMIPVFPKFLEKRYTIRRLIGRGAFGVVYLAEDKKIGRLVAIKILYDNFNQNNEIQERFMQEARIAGQLEHPNIIIVYNIEEENSSPAIIMEYLGGGSLKDLMKKNPQMDLKICIQIIIGILTGLDVAHHIYVVHRDIKPQNILFGIGSNPKITDFGIAHLPLFAGGSENIIKSEQEQQLLIGTPIYMPPEQVTFQKIDGRTDLYAAGVIFYEMLTGQSFLPITNKMESEKIVDIILNKQPERIKKYRKEVPKKIESLIFQMTAKKAENRFPDPISVKRELIMILSKLGGADLKEYSSASPDLFISPARILKDIVHLLLVDGMITPAERQELHRRTERLGLSEIQEKAIEEEVRTELDLPALASIEKYSDMLKEFFSENKSKSLTPEQTTVTIARQKEFNISEEEDFMIKSHILKDFGHLIKSKIPSVSPQEVHHDAENAIHALRTKKK